MRALHFINSKKYVMYEEDKDIAEEDLLSPLGDDALDDDGLLIADDEVAVIDEETEEDEAY